MRMRSAFLCFFILISIQAKVTEFRWLQTQKDPPKGECYEVDIETGGKKYLQKVLYSKCRPPEDKTKHIWLGKSDQPGGECYLVDSETGGEKFSKFTSWTNCEPENTETHLIEGRCYLKGETKEGALFLMGVPKKRCKSKSAKPVFVLGPTGRYGRCASVDPQTGETFNESVRKCKPEETKFIPLEEDGRLSCYEVASEGGPQKFIRKVSNNKCRPEETVFSWVQEEPMRGTCYQVAKEGGYKEKTSYKKCAEKFNTEKQFVPTSPIRGICYLIDQESQGKAFRYPLNASRCRPDPVEVGLVQYQGSFHCIEYDKEEPRAGYRKKTNMKECHNNTGEFTWVQDDEDPMKGFCYQKYTLKGQLDYKSARKTSCRPKEPKVVWYYKDDETMLIASCYEIHPKEGPAGYADEIERKKCKPKEDLVLRYFHPNKFKKGGCYLVDPQTKGELYSVRTDPKKCKNEFL